jgi:hypothetical protein
LEGGGVFEVDVPVFHVMRKFSEEVMGTAM